MTCIHQKLHETALAGIAQWIECGPVKQRVCSSVLVRAHAWVVSQVSSRGPRKGNCTLMFLSLSFFLPLSKNKKKNLREEKKKIPSN